MCVSIYIWLLVLSVADLRPASHATRICVVTTVIDASITDLLMTLYLSFYDNSPARLQDP